MTSSIVGRDRELARVEGTVRRGLSGEGSLVLLSGEAGIGKTRLADHASRVATECGATVAWGRCWEAGGAPAFWPWIEVFRALGATADPFAATEPGEAPSDARFRSFDLAVRRLVDTARERPLAIVLDDLHAADVPSLLVLQLLVRGLRGVPLAVVATYRDAEARVRRDVAQILAKIAREGDGLSLEPLRSEDVAEWLRREGQESSRAAEVHRLTEGNPLFVQEVLRIGGSARPSRLPEGLGAVLDEHLARVSPETIALLECGAILGREFAPAEAARLAGMDAGSAAAAVAEATDAALLSFAARGRRTFIHMLVRDRLVERMPPARRTELHYQAGEIILESRTDLVSAAHHFIEGSAAGDLGRVLQVVQDAAERSLVNLAFEGAAELGESALGLLAGSPPTRAGCGLLVVTAEAHLRAGAMAAGKERCIEAARVAKSLGATDLMARAALAYGSHFTTAVVDPVMVSLLEDALSAQEAHDHPVRARIMARLAAALVPPRPEDADRIAPLGREAVAMARRLEDDDTLLYALQYATASFGYTVSAAEREALQEEIMALARKTGNRSALLVVMGFRAALLLEAGRRAEALSTYAEYETLLEHFPQPQYQWRKYSGRAALAALDGNFEEARRAGLEILQVAEGGNVMSARVAWALLQIAIAHAEGNPAAIQPDAERVLAIITKIPPLAPYSAWVLAAQGRTAEAREMLRGVALHVKGFPWLIAAADAAVVMKDEELAGQFYEPLSAHRYQNRIFWGPAGAFCVGPTPRTLGDLAMILRRPEDALAHYDEAIVVSERVGSKPLLALSRKGREAAVAALSRKGAGAPQGSAALESAATNQPGGAAPVSSGRVTAPVRSLTLRQEGDVWAVGEDGGATIRLKDGKGLRYLERLLATPGQEVHVLDLVGSEEAPADAGAVLDAKAKERYKRRLEDLRDELEEATRNADPGRSRRAQEEIDAIADQLASAVGLGGRDRKAASNVERARINVQRRLRDVVDRVTELDPALGRWLSVSIRTGTYCSFSPP